MVVGGGGGGGGGGLGPFQGDTSPRKQGVAGRVVYHHGTLTLNKTFNLVLTRKVITARSLFHHCQRSLHQGQGARYIPGTIVIREYLNRTAWDKHYKHYIRWNIITVYLYTFMYKVSLYYGGGP